MTHTEIQHLNRLVEALENAPSPALARPIKQALKMGGGRFLSTYTLAQGAGLITVSKDSFGRMYLALEPDYLRTFAQLHPTVQARRPGRPMRRAPHTVEAWVKALRAEGWTCIPPKSTESA